jgi:hypothetical protein
MASDAGAAEVRRRPFFPMRGSRAVYVAAAVCMAVTQFVVIVNRHTLRRVAGAVAV